MRSVGGDRTEREFSDDGFGLIEQVIAMVVIVIVMLGLLGTLGATAKSVVTGRQRTIAVSLAKQAIENMQGAKYSDVASGTGVTADPLLVAGKFEAESLVLPDPAATVSYRTFPVSVGTTFSLRTFVTSVAAGYRRVTVIIDWPSSAPKHTLRFSSLVYPVVNTSYPASDGLAESMGGSITLSGCLGGDVFDDVNVALPGARADTSASTLRSAIGGAGGASSHVEVHTRSDRSACALDVGTSVGDCPRTAVDSIADNDSLSTSGNLSSPTVKTFSACTLATTGGLSVVTPAGTGASALVTHAKTDSCTSCSFAGTPSDAVPWADASVTSTAGTSATFTSGGLAGSLWSLGNVWTATSSVDHDAAGGGVVIANAALAAPALSVFNPTGGPVGFSGAIKVSALTANASAASGYTSVAPTVPGATASIQLWNGTGYSTVNWVVGTALDQSASATFVIAGKQVAIVSRVKTQVASVATVATNPRTDALSHHPSVLVVTVAVTITASVPVPPTTTTSASTTTSVAPTTTVVAAPIDVDAFSIVVDYGRVSAHGTFLAQAA